MPQFSGDAGGKPSGAAGKQDAVEVQRPGRGDLAGPSERPGGEGGGGGRKAVAAGCARRGNGAGEYRAGRLPVFRLRAQAIHPHREAVFGVERLRAGHRRGGLPPGGGGVRSAGGRRRDAGGSKPAQRPAAGVFLPRRHEEGVSAPGRGAGQRGLCAGAGHRRAFEVHRRQEKREGDPDRRPCGGDEHAGDRVEQGERHPGRGAGLPLL